MIRTPFTAAIRARPAPLVSRSYFGARLDGRARLRILHALCEWKLDNLSESQAIAGKLTRFCVRFASARTLSVPRVPFRANRRYWMRLATRARTCAGAHAHAHARGRTRGGAVNTDEEADALRLLPYATDKDGAKYSRPPSRHTHTRTHAHARTRTQ